ncbi:MAG: GreA/GreB family elongation factor [Actinomycetota bacterium]|nr:GreA/GreB family elongation factor [Actinomycetota bacterium]
MQLACSPLPPLLRLHALLYAPRIIREEEIDLSEVALGSTVYLEDVGRGEELKFRLVSAAEARGGRDCLSDQSPVGRAILGRKAGEVVDVQVPSGVIQYRILRIER